MLPSRACHSLRASGTNLRRYVVFPLPASDRVNVNLDSLIFLCNPVTNKFSQLSVCKGFDENLEDFRGYHVKSRTVVAKYCHWLFSGDTKYLRRVFLEFRHANGEVGVNSIHVHNYLR